ncbi:MAG TPA: N(4)-(beta-N-acetylglucosaminyl)-L-asparaginase [Acidimicrobiales bacterium]|nr:N(4)-(beta-N-acetylglucosaminyl)-L-asparaginase [Acidimicrobiales bacterium]
MILVASANGSVGMETAWDVLRSGRSALDAVEAGARAVEDEPSDHTVGFGGYPNLLGAVELDASIMDGTTRRAGAVGGLRGYRAAVTVARAVMERLPHVLVVGDGAARLAAEIGLPPEDLLTPEAERTWREGIEGRLPDGSLAATMLSRVASLATDPERAAGTVDFLAVDRTGAMASAVSTSGWAWKYPGRLGDSPVIGAGNYCDGRYGAAACTGFGELAIRAATARSVVAGLARGDALTAACEAAMHDLADLGVPSAEVIMHLVALDAAGGHAGYTTREGATYVVRTESMSTHEVVPRTVVVP